MKRPALNQYNKLSPILIQQYEKYLPNAFDESLSILEKVNLVIQQMNKMGELTNNVVEDWNNLNKWIMENGFDEQVRANIERLREDGTLAEILNDELVESIRDELNHNLELEVERLDKKIDDVTTYPDGISKMEVVNDVLDRIGKDTFSVLENLLENGDFSNGVSPFFAGSTTGSIEEINGVGVTHGQNNGISTPMSQLIQNEIPVDEVWYAVAEIRTLNEGCDWLGVGFRSSTVGSTGRVNNPVKSTWYTVSHYWNGQDNLSGNFAASAYGYFPNEPAPVVEIDNFMVFNLTKTFGRGYEPTKEEMDAIAKKFRYFEGELGAGKLTKFLTSQQQTMKQLIKDEAKVNVVNKVINGDFEKGLSPSWTVRERVEVDNGKAILTGQEGQITTGIVGQTMAQTIPENETWYFVSRLRALDVGIEWIGVGARGSTGNSTGRIYNPVSLQWYNVSHYMTSEDFQDLSGLFGVAVWGGVDPATDKRVEVDYYMAFNLTEIFGEGNEPTKEQMDELLLNHPYFEGDIGSATLSNKLLKLQTKLELEVKENSLSELENVLDLERERWVSWSNTYTNATEDGLRIRGNGLGNIVATTQHVKGEFKKGHKFFVSGEFNPEYDLNSYGFGLISGTTSPLPVSYVTTTDVAVGEWKKIDGVIEIPEDTDFARLQIRAVFPSASESEDRETYLRGLFLYDLTSFFGEGNEPNAEGFKLMLNSLEVREGKSDLIQTQKGLAQLLSYELKRKANQSAGSHRPVAVVGFDDNNITDYEKAFPFLEARGIKATTYVITSSVGNEGKVSWEQLHELKKAGWDVEFHTHNHIDLDASSDSEIRQDFETGIQTFIDNGFPKPRHLAYPFGRGTDSERVRSVIGEYIKTARNSRSYFSGVNNSYDDIDFLRFNGLSIDMNEHRQDRLPVIKQLMEEAREKREIVCLYAHKLVDSPPTNDNVPETIFEQWAELIDYARDLDFEFITMDELYLRLI